ncbi:MAG: glycosyltransferase [Candidatus Omnitrophota bacterium]
MSNRLVSIIIVTAGKDDYALSLLESIKRQTYLRTEVFIIDNSLDPGLGQKILINYPLARLYPQKENILYCQALNFGITQSKGDFILCLNDDIILEHDFIEKAIQGFGIHQRIGMVSPKILRSDRKTIDSTGLFLGRAYTAVERGYGRKDYGQFEKPGYVFGVNGAVAFYRRVMLEDIRKDGYYFDPAFRIFYEDLDVAWRAQGRGWKGYYLPSAVAYHVRGATVRRKSGIDRYLAGRYLEDGLLADLIKNRYLTVIRNETPAGFIARLPFALVYDIIMWGYLVIFRPGIFKKILASSGFLKTAFCKRCDR